MASPDSEPRSSFADWLEQIGLGHCSGLLIEQNVGFDVVQDLTQEQLRQLGIKLGDSLRLLKAIKALAPAAARSDGGSELTPVPARPAFASRSERCQLTVMFCDLVESTSLARRLGEGYDEVLAAYRETCREVVESFGGSVAQLYGDGVLVYFGAPEAHEDDAEGCIRAALDLVQAVRGLRLAEPIAVRIGVATGRVTVGALRGGNAESALAVGEPPNLAQRLQKLSGRNEVVIDPSTRRLVGSTFDLVDLGIHALDGFEPMRAWRVQSVLRTAGRFDAAHGEGELTDLVGREEEVALLLRHWHLARSGEGQVVLLGGEPGIGKSRLARVMIEHVNRGSHTTLRYQCSTFRRHSALYPFIEQAEFAAGFTRDDTPEQKLDKLEAMLVGDEAQRAEAKPLFAALLSLPTDRYPPLGLPPREQKEKTLDMLIRQLEALARLQPRLVVVEDAHWIDPTSQELLDLMMPRLGAMRVLLLLTYRPDEYTPRGNGYPHVAMIGLTGLPQRLGTELVEKVTVAHSLPPEVVQQIVARADGVPLFIEELTKSVLESGLLHEEDERHSLLSPLRDLTVPAKLRNLLRKRLGRRSGILELAQIGACIGREFPWELLAAVSPYQGPEFDAELEQLIATGLVFRRGTPPDATYTFKHALVQDAAYESLVKPKRQDLHAKIAAALETMFRERVASEPELLARHFTEAGNLAKAIPLWRLAGEAALKRVANREAVAYLKEGLAIVVQMRPAEKWYSDELSLRERLHAARLRFQGWAEPEVGANAAKILELAERQGSSRSLLVGLWGMWVNTITQGRIAESPKWADRLLAEGERSGDLDLQILGHRGSMTTHFYLGELREADQHGNRARALYAPERAGYWTELTGSDVITAVGVFSSQWTWMLGYPDRASELSDQKDADARRLGHPFDLGWALTWGAFVFDYRGEPERLLERVGEAERLGREKSIPIVYNVLVALGEGLARLRLGELDEAISLLQRGVAAWKASGGHLHVPYFKCALAEAAARKGDLAAAFGLIDECLDQIEREQWHERVWMAEVLRLKGWMLIRAGRIAEAEAQLRESMRWARDQHARSWELRSATTLAQLLAERGERDAARELLAPVYGWFTEGFDTHDLKTAGALLASLA